jgi:uncharacterized protein YukE
MGLLSSIKKAVKKATSSVSKSVKSVKSISIPKITSIPSLAISLPTTIAIKPIETILNTALPINIPGPTALDQVVQQTNESIDLSSYLSSANNIATSIDNRIGDLADKLSAIPAGFTKVGEIIATQTSSLTKAISSQGQIITAGISGLQNALVAQSTAITQQGEQLSSGILGIGEQLSSGMLGIGQMIQEQSEANRLAQMTLIGSVSEGFQQVGQQITNTMEQYGAAMAQFGQSISEYVQFQSDAIVAGFNYLTSGQLGSDLWRNISTGPIGQWWDQWGIVVIGVSIGVICIVAIIYLYPSFKMRGLGANVDKYIPKVIYNG